MRKTPEAVSPPLQLAKDNFNLAISVAETVETARNMHRFYGPLAAAGVAALISIAETLKEERDDRRSR